jgi:glycosyltransferase involved in cell wall biosynthesis
LRLAVARKLGPHVVDPSLPQDAIASPGYERSVDIAADRLDRMIAVEPTVDSSIIGLRFVNRDARMTHDGLAALLDAYHDYRLKIFDRDRLPFLEKKRDEAVARLESARAALAAFRQTHEIVSISEQITLLLDEQSKLILSAMDARRVAAERAAAGAALAVAAQKTPPNVVLNEDTESSSESGNSRSILLGLQLRRQELLSKYADTSHYITDIDQQIAALKSFEDTNQPRKARSTETGVNPVAEQINGDLRAFEQERAGNEAKGQEAERQAETVKQRLLELTGLRLEDRHLERAVELADDQYRIVLKHYDDALVAEAVEKQSAANVRVIEQSSPSRTSGGGRRLAAGLGLLAGVIAAVATAFTLSAFRETMLTPAAAERRLGLPVLARVAARGRAAAGSRPGKPGQHGEPRRVLIVVENLPVPFDRRVWNEATTLKAAGYEVTVICPAMKPHLTKYEVIEGIHIYRHWLPIQARGCRGYFLEYSVALLMEFWVASRVFIKHGFDVIHACNPPDTIFLLALPFRIVFGRRFLFDHHDLNPELYIAKFGRADLAYRLLMLFERWTFRAADVSIATNESYRRIAIDRGGMAPDKVFVVRSGPNLKRFQTAQPDPALLNGRGHLVAYVGTMGQQEGIHYLLEAALQIRDRHGRRDVIYRLVGDGPEVGRLKDLTRQMGLENDVFFEGRVSDQAMMTVLATASVCVNPDEYNELNDKSTMNKIMEYMAASRPVVQFDLTEGRVSAGEASDYARPNDAADMADKIVALLDDPERRQRMGEIGRRRIVEELSWEHEAPKLLAAYDALFSSR